MRIKYWFQKIRWFWNLFEVSKKRATFEHKTGVNKFLLSLIELENLNIKLWKTHRIHERQLIPNSLFTVHGLGAQYEAATLTWFRQSCFLLPTFHSQLHCMRYILLGQTCSVSLFLLWLRHGHRFSLFSLYCEWKNLRTGNRIVHFCVIIIHIDLMKWKLLYSKYVVYIEKSRLYTERFKLWRSHAGCLLSINNNEGIVLECETLSL